MIQSVLGSLLEHSQPRAYLYPTILGANCSQVARLTQVPYLWVCLCSKIYGYTAIGKKRNKQTKNKHKMLFWLCEHLLTLSAPTLPMVTMIWEARGAFTRN